MSFELDAFESSAFAGLLDALLEAPSADVCVLAEIQPMEVLGVWTAAGGGLLNTYYCTFSQYAATDVVPGGIYRRLDFVRQNSTTLTSRASAALVDANLGSYYFDTANARLYVSTTTGASPETYALVGAWFSLLLATDRVSFSDQLPYLPLITGSLPVLATEKPDLLFGATVADQGQLQLLNGDGLFDRLSLRWVWRNKTATFKLGGRSLGSTDFATVGTMRINGLAVDDELCTIQLEAIGSILNRSIPPRTWGDGTAGFAISGDGVPGQSQPWVFGICKECRLPLINNTGEIYGLIDGQFAPSSICIVDAVYAVNTTTRVRTTLSAGVDYSAGFTSVTITNVTYTHATYEIWADLHLLGGSTTAGGILQSLLRNVGEDPTNIDTAAFDAIDAAATANLGLYLTEPVQAIDVLRTLEQSVGAQVFLDATGRWTARLWDPSLPAAWSMNDADFVEWTPEEDLQGVLNEVRAQYGRRHATGDASEAASSDDRVKFGSETSDSHRIASYLRDQDPASVLANRARFLKSSPATRIRFVATGLTLMQASVGDMVAITRDRGPIARTGSLEGQLFELTKLEKALAGSDGAPQVSGVLEDLGGQTDRIARYTDGSTPLDWSTATSAQRALYGFYADANGYVDATDPLTRHGKVGY